MKKVLKRLHEYAKAASRAIARQKTAESKHRGFANHRPREEKLKSVLGGSPIRPKIEPKPDPNKVYEKPKAKVDHSGMRFVKTKNTWKNKSDLAISATPGIVKLQIRCSKRINKLSPKEKRAAWRHAHNTRPKKKIA